MRLFSPPPRLSLHCVAIFATFVCMFTAMKRIYSGIFAEVTLIKIPLVWCHLTWKSLVVVDLYNVHVNTQPCTAVTTDLSPMTVEPLMSKR